MYPLSNPSPKDDDRVIMYRAGQRAVVEYIKAKHNTEKEPCVEEDPPCRIGAGPLRRRLPRLPPAPIIEPEAPPPPPTNVNCRVRLMQYSKIKKRTTKRQELQQASSGANALRIPLNTGRYMLLLALRQEDRIPQYPYVINGSLRPV